MEKSSNNNVKFPGLYNIGRTSVPTVLCAPHASLPCRSRERWRNAYQCPNQRAKTSKPKRTSRKKKIPTYKVLLPPQSHKIREQKRTRIRQLKPGTGEETTKWTRSNNQKALAHHHHWSPRNRGLEIVGCICRGEGGGQAGVAEALGRRGWSREARRMAMVSSLLSVRPHNIWIAAAYRRNLQITAACLAFWYVTIAILLTLSSTSP